MSPGGYKLCHACGNFLATRRFNGVPVCYVCFMKMDTRLLEEKKAAVQTECEIELLQHWWNLDEARVNR